MLLFALAACVSEAPPATVEVVTAQRTLWPGIPIAEDDVALEPVLAERATRSQALTDLADAVGRRPTRPVDAGDMVKPGQLLVEQPGEAPGAVLSSADLTALFIPCLGDHPVKLTVTPSCVECALVVESSAVHVLEAGESATIMVGDSMNSRCAWHAVTRQAISWYDADTPTTIYPPLDYLVDPTSIDEVRLTEYGLEFGRVDMELTSPQSNCWQISLPGHPPVVGIPLKTSPKSARSDSYDRSNAYPSLRLGRGEPGLIGTAGVPPSEIDPTCPSFEEADWRWGTRSYVLAAKGGWQVQGDADGVRLSRMD